MFGLRVVSLGRRQKRLLSLVRDQVYFSQQVPQHIKTPPYLQPGWIPCIGDELIHSADPIQEERVTILTLEEQNSMRAAGKLAAKTLALAGTLVTVREEFNFLLYKQPGVTTEEIDRTVHEFVTNAGAYPSPLGYPSHDAGPFPKSICTSVNDVYFSAVPV
jgi:methionyl aminopeptidase